MKTYLTKLIILLGIVGLWGGCSLEDRDGLGDYELDELVLDDFVGDEWDGVGLPSWLRKRYFEDCQLDLGWFFTSYWPAILVRIYSFEYKNNVLLALSCEFYAYNKHESCLVCYTSDGRKIDFDKIKGCFNKDSRLIWSNALDGDKIPQVSDFKHNSEADLSWLQVVINQICEEIHEPDKVLSDITCGIAEDNGQQYVFLRYEYYDSSDISNGPIKESRTFNLNGMALSKEFDITKVISSQEWYISNGFDL